jgi:hypothetical protein
MRFRTFVILAAVLASAPAAAAPKGAGPEDSALRIGLVFCSSAFPLVASAYEGGFGAQLTYGKLLGRAGARFLLDDRGVDPAKLGWGLGLLGGYRITGGAAKLYAGAFADYSYSEEKTTVDADDWTKTAVSEIGFGPVVGVELEILENLSIFLDYELAFGFAFPSETVSAGGTVTKNAEDTERLIETRLGNSALIGVCIYFK